MLRFNPIHFTGFIVLAAITILWRCTSVHPSYLFPAKDDKRTRHGQTQTTFSSGSATADNHQQGSLSVQEPQQPSSLCTDPPPGHCEFYRDCLESKFHCGRSGYPLGYGEKFCQKFAAGKDQLSPAGQKWMMDTMQCLQRVLVPDATGPDVSVFRIRRWI